MIKLGICKCGMAEAYHTVGCYGNIVPDLYNEERVIELDYSKEFFQEFFERLEGEEGCNFTEDGKWDCDPDRKFSKNILKKMNVSEEDIKNILDLFQHTGGYCDCEVLFNSEESIMHLFDYKPKDTREFQIRKSNELNCQIEDFRNKVDITLLKSKILINELEKIRKEKEGEEVADRVYDRELKCGCLVSADGGGGCIPCSYPEVSTEEELQKCDDAWKEWQQTDDYKLYKQQVQERNE